jgi:hypothetical protein
MKSNAKSYLTLKISLESCFYINLIPKSNPSIVHQLPLNNLVGISETLWKVRQNIWVN